MNNALKTNAPTIQHSLKGYRAFQPEGYRGAGRSIYVKETTLNKLLALQTMSKTPSSEAYYALELLRSIDSLRSQVVPINSFMQSAKNSPRCIVTSSFEIEYHTNPSYVDHYQTDVFITDVRIKAADQKKYERAALWHTLQNDRERWQINEEPTLTLSGSSKGKDKYEPIQVGINGYCGGEIQDAASILPSHIARGDQRITAQLQNNGYELFYVPHDSSAVKAGWTFVKSLANPMSDKRNQESARILSGYMHDAHQQGLYVEWTSHRGGSLILTEAMNLLAQRNINLQNKQWIYLSDHTSSQHAADKARRAVGMDTKDSNWHHTNKSMGVAQWAGGKSFGTSGLACSIESIAHNPTNLNNWYDATIGGAQQFAANHKLLLGSAGIIGAAATMGMTPALISMISSAGWLGAAGAVGTAGAAALGNIPKLNQNYGANPVKELIKKLPGQN
ncbi:MULTISPECIES: hypothetical protein [Thalassolituus]|jgi:hypothetical protein|uniref:Uncharacterized protein n=1 Tax=Thalassolituus oleivorans MIL-1 TaxID=1298593 RepID=M5DN44_9GAMM|nr:hypothetical protein [Thalassolituus oleivorans]PCI47454.1 MAG: hypothetical protein COB43_11430 [Oceanospirillales bacterium]CCU70826.1 hypothetical protein TOL_0384 [Thalassolituus oleivorans MIL-1]